MQVDLVGAVDGFMVEDDRDGGTVGFVDGLFDGFMLGSDVG